MFERALWTQPYNEHRYSPGCGVNVLERARTTLSVLRSEQCVYLAQRGIYLRALPVTQPSRTRDRIRCNSLTAILVRITALARVFDRIYLSSGLSVHRLCPNKNIIPRWDDVVKFYRENYFASLERENFSSDELLCCVAFICRSLWLSSRFYRTPRDLIPGCYSLLEEITFSNISVSRILLFRSILNLFDSILLLLLLEGVKFVKCRISTLRIESCWTDLFDWPKETYDHRG